MKTIIWDEGYGVCDSGAQTLANKLLEVDTIRAGNSLVMNYARLLRVTGQIDGLEINWNGEIIAVNRYGAITDWPSGFCDQELNVAAEIIRESIKKRKQGR